MKNHFVRQPLLCFFSLSGQQILDSLERTIAEPHQEGTQAEALLHRDIRQHVFYLL